MKLVESVDAKPKDEGQLYIYWKILVYKWTHAVQTYIVQELTVIDLKTCPDNLFYPTYKQELKMEQC